VAFALGTLLGGGCGATAAPHPPSRPAPRTVVTTTTAPAFSMEPCGTIITDDDQRPGVDLEGFLLGAADAPAGLTAGPPLRAGTGRGSFVASVPSIVPIADIDFATSVNQAEEGVGEGSSSSGVSETLGEVTTANEAAGLVARIERALLTCTNGAPAVTLPAPTPGLVAVEDQGRSSVQELKDATVVVAKGPYVLNLTWSSSVNFSASTESTLPFTPLPSPGQMAALVAAALGRLPPGPLSPPTG